MFTLSLLFLIETFSRSRSFAINHESRQKRIRETSRIRNNINASILRIRFLINEFGDKEKSCRFWYVIKKKKEEKRKKYRTRRKKGWMGKHVVNSWVSGSCAEDNSDWSVAAGRLTRLVAFGLSSLPHSLSRTRTAHRWGCCVALCR